ncbi:branched-chain amino acid transport system II carrier protein [Natronincola ferrireducens]|uniref:Branched-chain amino acid transport system carrier protein n=1 Tax=Natronincola ferrireducens TaxID=393762 RepID=A0A1G9FEY9_9FIRM|nr:branched-chain amino acid transport system II carrier protein [Natronincola ferrireducens]SDK86930.1 branched-chain amino acid:cation transporter, LIVCS family [Natronincola ferrireducens]
MHKQTRDVIVVGFALFAMFLGAGNLIFPPSLGFITGDNWILAMFGFLLTGVGMPLLGIIAVSRAGGTVDHLANKVNPVFAKILGAMIMLAIGPLLAIPRTGATTFEIGIQPLFPEVSSILVSIIFFSITLFFSLNPTNVVDKIGKVLTPCLLIVLGIIIYKGVTAPLGLPVTTNLGQTFSIGFTEGYQTMDALGSVILAGIVISSIVQRGYTNTKDQIKLTIQAGLIAAIGLGVVYGGLIYLGATASGLFTTDTTKSQLIIGITQELLGSFGTVALAISVSLACLTTSIGLTATAGEYFNKLSNGRLSYKSIVIATVVFSGVFANIGVEKIVRLAIPILVTLYPIVIVLIVMNIFDVYIPRKSAYPGAVFGALIVSLFDALSTVGIEFSYITNLIARLPLANQGFGWLIPAVVGTMVTMIFIKPRQKQHL